MKKLIIIFALILTNVVHAETQNVLGDIQPELEKLLQPSAGRKTISEMKVVASENNTDIEGAFENYLIAKRTISVARAKFNPLTSGHLLGVSLGLSFLWAPVAMEAVFSIPTKIHNVHKNKFLAQVSYYNHREAKQVLSNELAHLYYDILIHEAMLKTIDLEIKVLTYKEATLSTDLRKRVLSLGLERANISEMYAEELAAIRNLISTDDQSKYALAEVSSKIDRSLLDSLDEETIQEVAIVKSDKIKAAQNLYLAAQSNVKQVKWSILSASGIDASYFKRIKEAQNEENISAMRVEGVLDAVKINALIKRQQLTSALDLFSHYESVSNDSLEMSKKYYSELEAGHLDKKIMIEVILNAIYDFRNKIVAHYGAWSSYDDFMTSLSR